MSFQVLAQVRRDTGRTIRLYPLEEVTAVRFDPDRIAVSVNRVWCKQYRRGLEVTHRGLSIYEFKLINGCWVSVPPFTQRWSISPELHTSWVPKVRDTAWEQLCYRPGTEITPQDGPIRLEQKKAWGY